MKDTRLIEALRDISRSIDVIMSVLGGGTGSEDSGVATATTEKAAVEAMDKDEIRNHLLTRDRTKVMDYLREKCFKSFNEIPTDMYEKIIEDTKAFENE